MSRAKKAPNRKVTPRTTVLRSENHRPRTGVESNSRAGRSQPAAPEQDSLNRPYVQRSNESKSLTRKALSPRQGSKSAVSSRSAGNVLEPAPSRSEGAPRAPQDGRYVYGVISSRSSMHFGKSGIGGGSEDVYTVHYSDIAAVVSRTPVFIFDPTRDNCLAHEHVIESVMKNHTIIPMAFGVVFRTDDDIREVLKSIYA